MSSSQHGNLAGVDLLGTSPRELHQGRSIRRGDPRMALFFTDYSLPLVGLRDGRWKFIHDLAGGRSGLFDLDRDAKEQADLSMEHLTRAAGYKRTLREWTGAQKAAVQTRRD